MVVLRCVLLVVCSWWIKTLYSVFLCEILVIWRLLTGVNGSCFVWSGLP